MSKRNLLQKKSRGIHRLTAGWASWRWLSGVSSKEKQWFIGTLMRRGGYESWMTHFVKGLQDPEFLLKFEGTLEPWERSKLVGQKISELRRSYRALSEEQRAELAKQAEVELETGLEIIGRDKKTIRHGKSFLTKLLFQSAHLRSPKLRCFVPTRYFAHTLGETVDMNKYVSDFLAGNATGLAHKHWFLPKEWLELVQSELTVVAHKGFSVFYLLVKKPKVLTYDRD